MASVTYQIRPWEAADGDVLSEVIRPLHWPFTSHDVHFIQNSPDVDVSVMTVKTRKDDGSVSESLIGTIALSYNGAYTFVGFVTVDERYRRRGLASKLMQHVVEQTLEAHRSRPGAARPRTSRLTATKMGEPVYRRLGYEVRGEAVVLSVRLVEMQRVADVCGELVKRLGRPFARMVSFFIDEIDTTAGASQLWQSAMQMDEQAAGGARGRLMREYLGANGGCVHFVVVDGMSSGPRLIGFCGVRRSTKHSRSIGPVNAHSATEAYTLLTLAMTAQLNLEQDRGRSLLSGSEGENAAKQEFIIFADPTPTDGVTFRKHMEDEGVYRKEFVCNSMVYTVPGKKPFGEAQGEDDARQYCYLDGGLG